MVLGGECERAARYRRHARQTGPHDQLLDTRAGGTGLRFCDPDARTAAEIADMQQQAAYAAEPIDGEADYYALRQALSDILRCARGMEGVQS